MPINSLLQEPSWRARLAAEFTKPYMQDLQNFLNEEKRLGKTIYPAHGDYFRALNTTPFSDVKVVILGQDPYHGPGQAHGLSFSVPEGVSAPPSLVNIFKEIEQDLSIPRPETGYLQSWANQGVLLLNSVLTVEAHAAASHRGRGWERFTDTVIDRLNAEKEAVVFLLWGSYAQKKGGAIDKSRHLVLDAAHPSPLSAYRGFLGCRHFSKTNDYLLSRNIRPIDWSL